MQKNKHTDIHRHDAADHFTPATVVSVSNYVMHKAASDTCSPDTSCIHLYPFVSTVAVYMYPVSATKLSLTQHYGDMYPLVSGYKLLVRDTCIRLHVSGVNVA